MTPSQALPDSEHGAIRHERSAETERAILDAARSLLAEGGVTALSMRVVAERVGLSATAIYHYFKGKDELVRKVVEGGYRRFGEYLQEAVEREAKGSIERLTAIGEGYVRFAFENQEYFRVLYNIQARIPRDLDELPGGGGYHLLRQCVVDAIEAGGVRDANPDLVAHYLWTCVHGLVTLTLACNLDASCACGDVNLPASAVDLFRSFQGFLTDGLRPRGSERLAQPDFVRSKRERKTEDLS
jgi:AcrR family transcriptional regulator